MININYCLLIYYSEFRKIQLWVWIRVYMAYIDGWECHASASAVVRCCWWYGLLCNGLIYWRNLFIWSQPGVVWWGWMGEGLLAIMTNDQSLLDIGSVNIAHDRHRQPISATVMMLWQEFCGPATGCVTEKERAHHICSPVFTNYCHCCMRTLAVNIKWFNVIIFIFWYFTDKWYFKNEKKFLFSATGFCDCCCKNNSFI